MSHPTAREKRARQDAGERFGCHVDAEAAENVLPDCVLDQGNAWQCRLAFKRRSRETCPKWKPWPVAALEAIAALDAGAASEMAREAGGAWGGRVMGDEAREPGFYWVKLTDRSGWVVIEWMGRWGFMAGRVSHFDDSDFATIGPRIQPPDDAP